MLKINIFIILVFLFSFSLYSTENTPVVFSEMTIDVPPGDNGSWIELYNRSNKAVKIDGYTIICNDKKILTFPDKNRFIDAKELMLIKFDKNVNNFERAGRFMRITDVVKVQSFPKRVKIPQKKLIRNDEFSDYPFIKQRAPGYCALFKNKQITKTNLVDYVPWGVDYESNEKLFNDKYSQWTTEKHLWDGIGIVIGMSPSISLYALLKEMAIERKLFNESKNLSKYWRPESIDESSPGKGNPWPPPRPPRIKQISNGEKLSIEVLRPFKSKRIYQLIKDDEIKIKLQIAKDIHFEEIIYNKLIPPKTTINDFDFKEGIYFARVRIDTDKVSTNWSSTSEFEYKKESP